MLQLILMFLGFFYPNNNVNTISNTPTSVQSSTVPNEELDTGGETHPIPPKK